MVRARLLLLVALLVALLLATAALGDVITLKNGRRIEGRIVQDTGDKIVVQISATIRMPIRRDQIRSIQEAPFEIKAPTPPRPSETDPAEPKPTPTETKEPEATGAKRVCFIQIQGPIMSDLVVEGISEALKRAKKARVDVAVLELDTPGGRIDFTEQICAALEAAELETVAYLPKGESHGAFSAGAIISLTCDRIYMAPGTAIGAATPLRFTIEGLPEVTEKMVSATSAFARSTATKHGHPPALAAAMVDPDAEIREVEVGAERQFVSPDQVEALVKKGGKAGRWVIKRGKLLTLTADEAVEIGLAAGKAESREELLKALGLEGARAADFKTAASIAKAIAERDEGMRKLEAAITTTRSKAEAADPNRHVYSVYEYSGTFTDGGRKWRRQSDECVKAWDLCLKLLREKLKLARRYPGMGLNEEELKTVMIEVKQYRDKVAADRGRKGLPR